MKSFSTRRVPYSSRLMRYFSVFLLCLLFLSVLSGVGAEDSFDNYGWFTRIERTDGTMRCSGSYIGTRYVLTADYCIKDDNNPSDFNAAVGFRCEEEDNCGYTEMKIPIDKVFRHDGGIAILKLNYRATPEVPAAIPFVPSLNKKQKELRDKEKLTLVGAGNTAHVNGTRDSMTIETKVISAGKCINRTSNKEVHEKVNSSEWVCSVPTGEETTCKGDSGAPLVTKGLRKWEGRTVIMAVHLEGPRKCDDGDTKTPLVHFQMSKASDFVRDTVCDDRSPPDWCGVKDTKEPTPSPSIVSEPTKPSETKEEPTEPSETKEPTKPPETKEPTKPPETKEPTKPPETKEPTKPPETKEPTKSPRRTRAPRTNRPSEPPRTKQPSEAPIPLPTVKPSTAPIADPTMDPTTDPTDKPTPKPTRRPTPAPSEEPTPAPSTLPTDTPSRKPTKVPTFEPTTVPTENPSAVPTSLPTTSPTNKPTQQPTNEPTSNPTEQPTFPPTFHPTFQPTDGPTTFPTQAPTLPPVSPLHILEGHDDDVWSLDFNPDGTRLVSSACDNNVMIWDVATGTLLNSQAAHDNCVRAVRYSPDGKSFMTGSDDNHVKLWASPADASKTSFVTDFYDEDGGWEGGVESVSWRKDGAKVVSACGDATIRVHHVDDGGGTTTLANAHLTRVHAADYDNDGSHIATGSFREVRIFDNAIFETKVYTAPLVLYGLEPTISFVEYSPDGKYLAVSYFDTGLIGIWDMEQRLVVRLLEGHGSTVKQVRWSPDGNYLISASHDNTARVWNRETGVGLIASEISAGFQAVAWADDGTNTIAAGANNDKIYVLRVNHLP